MILSSEANSEHDGREVDDGRCCARGSGANAVCRSSADPESGTVCEWLMPIWVRMRQWPVVGVNDRAGPGGTADDGGDLEGDRHRRWDELAVASALPAWADAWMVGAGGEQATRGSWRCGLVNPRRDRRCGCCGDRRRPSSAKLSTPVRVAEPSNLLDGHGF